MLLGTMRDARVVSGVGYDGSPVTVVELVRPDDRLVSVWCFHTALVSQFQRWRPRRGERLMLKYAGKVEGRGGDKYHDYRLAVDRPDDTGEIDWDTLATAAPNAAAQVAAVGAASTGPPPQAASTGPPHGGAAEDDIPF